MKIYPKTEYASVLTTNVGVGVVERSASVREEWASDDSGRLLIICVSTAGTKCANHRYDNDLMIVELGGGYAVVVLTAVDGHRYG